MSRTVSIPASDAELDAGEDATIYIRSPDDLDHGLGLVIISTPTVVEVALIEETIADAFKSVDWSDPVTSARFTKDATSKEESTADYSWDATYWSTVRDAVTSDTPVVTRGDVDE
ncbi:hypothetical protein BRD17_06405 [Halobacteriales archaeon SW_7_68_16]|nr:MAG: hypothetical protein BRD17_06405 [Halobacteriales archaeon SW_7_68_16]